VVRESAAIQRQKSFAHFMGCSSDDMVTRIMVAPHLAGKRCD
jgi:hypothetical protein